MKFSTYRIVPRSSQTNMIKWKSGEGSMWWSNGCDYLGYDFDNQRSQPAECGGLCAVREECVAFTWNNGVCYLKRGPIRNVSAKNKFSVVAPNCAPHATVCGYKGLHGHPLINKEKMAFFSAVRHAGKIKWIQDCSIWGADLRQVASRAEQCGDLCAADKECNTFEWQRGTCYLKKLCRYPIWNMGEQWPRFLKDAVCGRVFKDNVERNFLGWTSNNIQCL
ncbi:hypothetical protein WR25_18474 [Diploscapter pachys]|uniref:Apple domain-containing protein n=1 Tax=Diploscapter pachys TaxID=2018661 RepID=A0A2A2KN03_9BILA|nr:hypothetical protein WR25_18474 [Diploscapter pachys]